MVLTAGFLVAFTAGSGTFFFLSFFFSLSPYVPFTLVMTSESVLAYWILWKTAGQGPVRPVR